MMRMAERGGTDDLDQFMNSIFVVWREFKLPSYEYAMSMPYTRMIEMQKHLQIESDILNRKHGR